MFVVRRRTAAPGMQSASGQEWPPVLVCQWLGQHLKGTMHAIQDIPMAEEKFTLPRASLKRSMTNKECSDTGMAMVLICLLAGWFTGANPFYLGAISLLIVNMVWPRIFSLVAKGWLWLSHRLGEIMSKVVLTMVFFVVLTPLALAQRALGHDPMKRRAWKNGAGSVFEVRDHTFTPREIEHPY